MSTEVRPRKSLRGRDRVWTPTAKHTVRCQVMQGNKLVDGEVLMIHAKSQKDELGFFRIDEWRRLPFT